MSDPAESPDSGSPDAACCWRANWSFGGGAWAEGLVLQCTYMWLLQLWLPQYIFLAPSSHVKILSAPGVYAVHPSSDPAQAVEEVGILCG